MHLIIIPSFIRPFCKWLIPIRSGLEDPPNIRIVDNRPLWRNFSSRGSRFLLLILPPQAEPESARNHQIHAQIPQRKTMSQIPPGARFWSIKLRSKHCSQIPNRNRHSGRSRAFALARYVGSRPRKHDRGRRVDPCGGENRANVRDSRFVNGRSEKDNVPDYGKR